MFEGFDIYKDGWMFLTGGSNDVYQYFVEGQAISDDITSGWNDLLEERVDLSEEYGFNYLHIVAPEKISVYPDKMPFEIADHRLPSSQIEAVLSKKAKNVWVNPISFLRSQRENFEVYAKTDTHWNFVGAYSAYQLLQSRIGRPTVTHMLQSHYESKWAVMDLGGKLDPPLKEEVFFYALSDRVTRTHANDMVKFKERNNRTNDAGLHVGSYVVYENSKPLIDETVLIFGDSFSEYRGHLLTGIIAETYREVHFLWSSSFDINLIKDVKPDVVFSELAERFMSRLLPNNKFDRVSYSKNKLSQF